MKEYKYWDVLHIVCDFLRPAGDIARNEFMEAVDEWINRPNLVEKTNLEKANLSFETDFSNDLRSLGKYFVYAWVTESGDVFYVGCGGSGRVCDKYSRSEAFKELCEGATPYVLVSHCHKELAQYFENMCIIYFQLHRHHLVNNQKRLSDRELRYFAAKERGFKVQAGKSLSDKYDAFCTWRDSYPQLIEKLDDLIINCLPLDVRVASN